MNAKAEFVIGARDDTAAATASAKRNFAGLSSTTIAQGVAVGTVMAQLSMDFVAGLGRNITQTAAWADSLDELSQKTGLTAESLQSLNFAANIGGASAEKLGAGLKKLAVNMSAATAVGDDLSEEAKGAAAAFKAMGLSVDDLQKPIDSVLLSIADKFASYKGEADKAALATAIFSKAGYDLIPFLNNGAAGIDALRKEAEKLGIVMSGEKVKALAAFNDDLDRLKEVSSAASRELVSSLLPSLAAYATRLLDAAAAFGSIRAGMVGLFGSNPFASETENLSSVNARLREYQTELASIQKARAASTTTRLQDVALQKREFDSLSNISKAEKERAFWGAQVNRTVKPQNGPLNDTGPLKIAAPKIPNGKKQGGPTDDPAKKILDGTLKGLEDALAKERDVIAFQLQFMDGARSQEFISIAEAVDYKKEALDRELEAQIKTYDAEIAAATQYRAAADKQTEKQDATNKIAELTAKKAKAEQDANQKRTLLLLDQSKAQSSLNRDLIDYRRVMADSQSALEFEVSLLGKTELQVEQLTAAYKIQADVKERIRLAQKESSAPIDGSKFLDQGAAAVAESDIAIATRRRLDAQKDINKLLDDYTVQLALTKSDAQFELELIGKSALEVKNLADQRRIQLQLENDIRAAKKKGGDGVDTSQVEAQAAVLMLATRSVNTAKDAQDRDPWLQATESIRRYGEEAGNVGKQIGDVMSGAMKASEDALVNFVMTGKNSFGDLARSIIADLIRIQVRQMVVGIFGMISGGFSGGASAGVSGGSGLSSPASFGGYKASGGPVSGNTSYIVGEKGPEVFMPKGAGTIIPNHALGGGQSINYQPTINIDARSDQAAIRADVDSAIRRGNAELVDKLQRGRRI